VLTVFVDFKNTAKPFELKTFTEDKGFDLC